MEKGENAYLKKRIRVYAKWMILFCFCLVMFGSNPQMIHGYIDRMNPAIILLEVLDEEMVIEVEEMPKGCAEGMWIDVIIAYDGYQIIGVNEGLTLQKKAEAVELQRKLQQHSGYAQ